MICRPREKTAVAILQHVLDNTDGGVQALYKYVEKVAQIENDLMTIGNYFLNLHYDKFIGTA